MIKVLMCGNHPSNKGGMTSVISQLRKHEWEREGIQLKFIPTFYPGNQISKAIYFAASYLKIIVAIITCRPDVIHMHMSYKGSFYRKFMIHKLCKYFGIKDVIHLHGSEFEKWYHEADEKTKSRIKSLLKECDVFFVLGEKWKEIVQSIEPAVNVTVVPNAVSIPVNVVKWNEEQFRMLYMGVLIPRKGIDKLLQAFYFLKKEGRLGNCRLSIAGTGEDEKRLKLLVRKYSLENVVRFHGWINGKEKEKLILNSQAAVLPSFHEGLPVSVLEALSYGLPVIATDVGDMASAVIDGENGYLVQPGDIEQLVKVIEVVNDEKAFGKMSAASRRLAEEKFSENQFFATIKRCYMELAYNKESKNGR